MYWYACVGEKEKRLKTTKILKMKIKIKTDWRTEPESKKSKASLIMKKWYLMKINKKASSICP